MNSVILPASLVEYVASNRWTWILFLYLFWRVVRSVRRSHQYHVSLPSASYPFLTFIPLPFLQSLVYTFTAFPTLRRSYASFKPHAFKVREWGKGPGWHVFVTSPESVEELRKGEETVLSANAVFTEQIQTHTTLGPHIVEDLYHTTVIQQRLSPRVLGSVFPELMDEIVVGVEDMIGRGKVRYQTKDEWHSVPAFPALRTLITRVTNRIFVGSATCRNEEYIDMVAGFTVDLFVGALVVGGFEGFLKRFALRFTNVPKRMRVARKFLVPIIEERRSAVRKCVDEDVGMENLPNDLVTWFILESMGKGLGKNDDPEKVGESEDAEKMVDRIMAINLAAIHTTTLTLTFALLNLAHPAHAHYIPHLREEIMEHLVYGASRPDSATEWTKDGLSKCVKLDSFIKESMRVSSSQGALIIRRAVQPFTFKDGTHLPVGTYVSCPADAIHMDRSVWGVDAGVFEGFRHVRLDDGVEGETTKSQMVTASYGFMPFSYGKHACPGRFFAANEMKAIMAYILLRYDVKLDDDGLGLGVGVGKGGDVDVRTYLERKTYCFGTDRVPHPRLGVSFRRRGV